MTAKILAFPGVAPPSVCSGHRSRKERSNLPSLLIRRNHDGRIHVTIFPATNAADTAMDRSFDTPHEARVFAQKTYIRCSGRFRSIVDETWPTGGGKAA